MLKHIKNIKSHTRDGIANIWFTPIDRYYTRTTYQDIQPGLAKTFPLHLDFVVEEHCFEKYYRRRESSEVFSIELVLKGSMYFVQEGKKYHVMAGSVFLVHHGHNNEYTTGPEGYCHRLACIFDGHELNGLLNTTKLIEHDVIKLDNLEAVKTTMQKCFNELKEKESGFRRRASILGYKLLLELEENLQYISTPDLLRRAVNLMETHLSQQLSLKKIAEALNSTPISLNRIFQQHLKISPINYLINLKMEVAKSLLINTNMQIQEVAQNAGYSSALYFTSEFKKRMGMSPREFRKKKAQA
jgi:AraC-like DNA-binding protein